MIQKIKCYLGFHKFSDWKYVGKLNNFQYKQRRRCSNCGEISCHIDLIKNNDKLWN